MIKMASLYEWCTIGKRCDVLLISTDNIKIPAHRLVLDAASPYFEHHEGAEVAVPASATSIRMLLRWVYTNDIAAIGASSDLTMARELLAVAQQMQLPTLFSICCAEFKTCIDDENAVEILMFASEHKLKQIANKAALFLKNVMKDRIPPASCNGHKKAAACEDAIMDLTVAASPAEEVVVVVGAGELGSSGELNIIGGIGELMISSVEPAAEEIDETTTLMSSLIQQIDDSTETLSSVPQQKNQLKTQLN